MGTYVRYLKTEVSNAAKNTESDRVNSGFIQVT